MVASDAPDRPHSGLHSRVLREARDEFAATGEEAREIAENLGVSELGWRPAEDRWSIAECLEHLVRTGEAYLPGMDEAVAEGRRKGRTVHRPYRPSPMGRFLAWLLEPPARLRIPAPRSIQPGRLQPGADCAAAEGVLARFLGLRAKLEARMQAADGLDLRRIRISSPFVALLRFDLGSAFRIIAAHERRHLQQARRVRELLYRV